MQIEAYLINLFKYNFKSDDDRQITGISVRFIVPEEGGSDNQIGASIQKMSMPIDAWESLQDQGLQTFSKAKLTFEGFGRSMRLVKLEKVDSND